MSEPTADYHPRALVGEPTFTLLARDQDAPGTVKEWAYRRERAITRGEYPPEDKGKVASARAVAVKMDEWRIKNGPLAIQTEPEHPSVALPYLTPTLPAEAEALEQAVRRLTATCFGLSFSAGWWTDLATGQQKQRNIGEALMLVVSEVGEAMEGHRKNLQDDKLPEFKMVEVELADALIRIFDLAGGMRYRVAQAFVQKLLFNLQREDHKISARQVEGGKAY